MTPGPNFTPRCQNFSLAVTSVCVSRYGVTRDCSRIHNVSKWMLTFVLLLQNQINLPPKHCFLSPKNYVCSKENWSFVPVSEHVKGTYRSFFASQGGDRILLSSQSWGRELLFPEAHYKAEWAAPAGSKPYALWPLLASVIIATQS